MPLGERHVVLTEHVCNERGESINLTQPISRLCGSTSLTSQPSAIDRSNDPSEIQTGFYRQEESGQV